jgi:hypothetical protein
LERLHSKRCETIRQAMDGTTASLLRFNPTATQSVLGKAGPVEFEDEWEDAGSPGPVPGVPGTITEMISRSTVISIRRRTRRPGRSFREVFFSGDGSGGKISIGRAPPMPVLRMPA